MLPWVNVRYAIVMTFIMQSSWRNCTFEEMKGRSRGTRSCASRRDRVDALHLFLPVGRRAVCGQGPARCLHPFRSVYTNAIVSLRSAHTRSGDPGGEQGTSQQCAPIHQTVSRNSFVMQLGGFRFFNFAHDYPHLCSWIDTKTKLPRCRRKLNVTSRRPQASI